MKLISSAQLGLALLVSEVLLSLSRRSNRGMKSSDAGSLRVIWLVVAVAISAGIFVAKLLPGAAMPARAQFSFVGLVVFMLGLALRRYSIIHLGRFFTVNVAIAADHQLIETGPYRFVRHPSYTGALLAFAGFALVLGNWLAFLEILVPVVAAFIYRMNVEESALIAALGDDYVAYTRRTKRLLPFIY